MVVFDNLIFMVINALLVVTVTYVIYCKWKFRYWRKRKLECFEEPSIPFGNGLWAWRNKFTATFAAKAAYDAMKRKGNKFAGGFMGTVPFWLANDPTIIKSVLQEDFENFSQRLYEQNTTTDVFAANLTFVTGKTWNHLRATLTPAFKPAKLRILFDGIKKCAQQMQNELDSGPTEAINITKVAHCYFADVISISAYGLKSDSFKNANSEFIDHAANMIHFTSLSKMVKMVFSILFPKVSKLLNISMFPKECTNFFIDFAKHAVKFRKQNKVVRKAIFQVLLDAETELNVEEMDDEASHTAKIIKDMAFYIFIVFVAGFETSSIVFSYCLYELSQNLKIQDKLAEEIDRVLTKYEGNVTYDAIMEMTYLGQVVDETLRKYPPMPIISRKCVKDYKLGDTTIEKGIMVGILIYGLHHDPEYYPDPEKFDPERFSEDNKQKRIPFTYLPFGEGPRSCPAYRFGLMQIKIGLVVLLQQFAFSASKKMTLPIELDSYSITMNPKSEILLDIKDRNVHKQ